MCGKNATIPGNAASANILCRCSIMLTRFVITNDMYVHASYRYICDHVHRGMLFCDHITTIEAISLAECNKINGLPGKCLVSFVIKC